jgi:hypothetical protein
MLHPELRGKRGPRLVDTDCATSLLHISHGPQVLEDAGEDTETSGEGWTHQHGSRVSLQPHSER